MRGILKTAVVCLGLVSLSGCVGSQQAPLGPEAFVTPSADGQTRIIIFRDDFSGLMIQPKVLVDGQPVATCAPGKATAVTVSPGNHRVSGTTLTEKSIEVSVPKGNTVYVSCAIGLGIVVGPVELAVREVASVAPKVAKMLARGSE